MFPEIAREDIFRLETKRLWLRWPASADVGETPAIPRGEPNAHRRDAVPETSTGDPHEGFDAATVARLRAANASGTSLHLVMSGRGTDRRAFGIVSLVPVRERLENCGLVMRVSLAPAQRGQGLMTEAVQAVVDTAFMLTDTPLVAASARVLDPAFRRVLEKCGFAYCGTGLDAAAEGAGLTASDRLRLDRKAWASLKAWRIPGVVRHRGAPALDDCPACG